MKLVDNWRQCRRWYSQHANMVGMAFSTTYLLGYDAVERYIPPRVAVGLLLAAFLLGFFGRMVKQKPKGDGNAEAQ